MLKRKWFFLMIFSMPFINSCRSQSVENKVDKLITKGNYKDFESYKDFANSPKSAISLLISAIDTNIVDIVGLPNPRSSTYWPRYDNYAGIRAAYAIEYMIADSNRIKDVKNGIILRLEKGDPIYEPLTMADMKEIKDIYERWWKKNKDISIAELRRQWSFEKPILQSSKFEWY